MEENKREAAWDCKFYKDEKTCAALRTMVCKEKACKFYKGIGMIGGKQDDRKEDEGK